MTFWKLQVISKSKQVISRVHLPSIGIGTYGSHGKWRVCNFVSIRHAHSNISVLWFWGRSRWSRCRIKMNHDRTEYGLCVKLGKPKSGSQTQPHTTISTPNLITTHIPHRTNFHPSTQATHHTKLKKPKLKYKIHRKGGPADPYFH
jgi:hypothetical protein